jgi:hypothetical protein
MASEADKRVVKRVQKPKSVMIWAAITSNGKTPLVFVNQDVCTWKCWKITSSLDQENIFMMQIGVRPTRFDAWTQGQ